jgi:hypothetical protein
VENLSESLIELCALRNLGLLTTETAIEFGVNALIEGADSPALRRLAGAYPRDHLADVIPWLDKALTELGIEKSQFEMGAYYRPYSRLLTKQVLKGTLSPHQGLKRLAELLYLTPENDRLLYFFSELDDALDFWPQDPDEANALYPELGEMPPEDCIRAECELFLALSEHPVLREDLFLQAYCPRCETLARPLYRPMPEPWSESIKRLIARGHRPHQALCSQCLRPDPLNMSSIAGRRQYLANKLL